MTLLYICIIVTLVLLLVLGIYYHITHPQVGECHPKTEKHLILPLFEDSQGIFKTKIHLGKPTNNKIKSTDITPEISNESKMEIPTLVGVVPIDSNNTIESHEITVVPDTGSSMLIISGKDCFGCRISDGYFDITWGRNVSFGITRTIDYAGGQSSKYLLYTGYLLDYGAGQEKEIPFGLVVSTKSHHYRTENVLGLQPGGFFTGSAFIDYLCGPKKILFDFPGQKIIIGNVSSFLPRTPSVEIRLSLPSILHRYLLGDISSIALKITNQMDSIPETVRPRYAIFDTGTTQTLVRPELEEYISMRNHDKIVISFLAPTSEQTTNNPILTFPIKMQRNQHIIKSNSQLPEKTILIGNQWMKNYQVLFDYVQRAVTFFLPSTSYQM